MVEARTIIDFLAKAVANKTPLEPGAWLNAAMRLSVLLSDENDRLADMEQSVAKMKLAEMEKQDEVNVAAVRVRIEATDEYTACKKQRAFVKTIEELIRVAKKMSDSERGY